MYKKSIEQPAQFWAEVAENFTWFKKWDKVLDWSDKPFAKWFVNGKTNIAYNCLDRQIAEGNGDKVAYYWVGEPVDERVTLTYNQLHEEVCKFANVLKSRGVAKGDRVAIYLPMVPELVISMLHVLVLVQFTLLFLLVSHLLLLLIVSLILLVKWSSHLMVHTVVVKFLILNQS
jgi:acetyl-CoA synthetase